jgi:peptidoglycan/xylan/chitin deacetylase (PgdA/CDA1 family)
MGERANSWRWVARRTVKAALASALCAAGARWAVRVVRRRQAGGVRVLILSYHRVTGDFAGEAGRGLSSLLVSTGALRRQLEQLGREREVVSLAEACAALAAGGERAGGRDLAAITFDDGYAEVHGCALPVLSALKMPATVFIATGYIGTQRRLPHDRLFATLSELRRREGMGAVEALPPPLRPTAAQALATPPPWRRPGIAGDMDALIHGLPHRSLIEVVEALEHRVGMAQQELPPGTRLLSWGEVRELAGNGVEIGGHTIRHAVLPNLSLTEARAEISGCRAEIQARLGKAPTHFAYPNGSHSPAVRQEVAACGFDAAVTTEDRENRRGGDGYALRRKVLWESSSLGARAYSRAVAACNLDGVFGTLGWSHPVSGEQADPPASAPLGRGEGGRAETPWVAI